MQSEWHLYQVADLIAQKKLFVGDGYRAKNEELSTHGLPFARAGNIDGGFHFEGADCFPADRLARVGNKVSSSGDVVFTSKGTVGRFAFVGEKTKRFIYSPQLCFWRSLDVETINPRFLYYWMLGPDFYGQFKGVAGQTDMAEYVSLTDQRRMNITLPPLPEQKAIAQVLASLDDKIELNRRMNATLEALAQTLFRAWFVDFEPVKAKAAGLLPAGMNAETAVLFPDSFEPSTLGMIPKGWEVGTIGDLVEIVGGGTPSTKDMNYWENGKHFWATPKDFSNLQFPILLNTERQISDAGLKKISSGLLPRGAVLLSSRAPIGYLAITEIPVAINQGFIAMIPRENISNLFILHWAKTNLEVIKSRANGSTFLEISKTNFRPISLVRPPQVLMELFDLKTRGLFEHMINNERQSQTLAEIRDALLPRLISGTLRVPEALQVLADTEAMV